MKFSIIAEIGISFDDDYTNDPTWRYLQECGEYRHQEGGDYILYVGQTRRFTAGFAGPVEDPYFESTLERMRKERCSAEVVAAMIAARAAGAELLRVYV